MLTKGAYFYESGSGVNLKSRKITFKIGDLFRICFCCLGHECGHGRMNRVRGWRKRSTQLLARKFKTNTKTLFEYIDTDKLPAKPGEQL